MAKKNPPKRKDWSKNEVTQLRKLFPNSSAAKVAAKLKRTVPSVMYKAGSLKLKKTKKYLKSIGRK